MLNQPISSPMMKTMLGFCCAAAGTTASARKTTGPVITDIMRLQHFMTPLPTFCDQPASFDARHTRSSSQGRCKTRHLFTLVRGM